MSSEKQRIASAKWYQKNKERAKANVRAWAAKNPERAKALRLASMQAWRKRNPTTVKARYKAWREANSEILKAACARWTCNNKGAVNALSAAYRTRKLQAMPPWVDKKDIKFVYDMAALFGVTVDHIVPLKGKNVCGLHVPWNLQLLPKSENSRKHNHFQQEAVF